jgi:phage terminase large subunit
MPSEIIIEDCANFKQLYNLPKDINVIVCIGGRGGRKTYEVSKFIAKSAAVDKKRCVILRDEKALIKESILNDILARYDAANEYGHLSITCDRMETGIKDKKTGEMLVFTKGFRASDGQKKANLKGSSNIDIAVIEEAEDIRDVDKFNTFHDSLRKQGSIIIIILNTPDINHWIIKRYFNCLQAKDDVGNILDGYFEIVPKEIKGFLCIKTGYENNPFLPEHTVEQYKGYGNPDSHLYNLFYYYTAIKGYASTGRRGQILTKVKPIKLADYMALPFKETYGQDFGTSSPAAFVGVKFDGNNSYCRLINYKSMEVLSIGKLYATLQLNKQDHIIADSAEPATISRLSSGWKADELDTATSIQYPFLLKGFFIEGAEKGPGSNKTGISLMQSLNLFAVEENTELWAEIYNWIWAVDKNGNATDEPLDDWNHAIDAWRYVIAKRKGQPKKLPSGYFR